MLRYQVLIGSVPGSLFRPLAQHVLEAEGSLTRETSLTGVRRECPSVRHGDDVIPFAVEIRCPIPRPCWIPRGTPTYTGHAPWIVLSTSTHARWTSGRMWVVAREAEAHYRPLELHVDVCRVTPSYAQYKHTSSLCLSTNFSLARGSPRSEDSKKPLTTTNNDEKSRKRSQEPSGRWSYSI